MSNYDEINDLNESKLNKIKLAIIKLERDNLKTREKTTEAMVDTIQKIIMDEVKKTY